MNNQETISFKQCPCVECMCKAICRHKSYVILFKECITISRYILYYSLLEERNLLLSILQESLYPTKWEYRGGGFIKTDTGAVFNGFKR